MSVQAVSNIQPIKIPNQNLGQSPMNVQPQAVQLSLNEQNQEPKKNDLLKNFEIKIKNTCDMEDTINVPRTIFKGYLSFMIGTALASINGLIKAGENGQNKKLKAGLAVASTLISLFGTWSFVRPYVIKDSQKKD